MGYTLPRWKDPQRKRNIHISHLDKSYCWYYDLDLNDFEFIVNKVNNNINLNDNENDRFGKYLYTICYIVLENKKFKNKNGLEKSELIEQAMYELMTGLKYYNPNKGKLYSLLYRYCYVAYCHYYTFKNKDKLEQDKIIAHVKEELDDYYYEFSTHKVNTQNYGD